MKSKHVKCTILLFLLVVSNSIGSPLINSGLTTIYTSAQIKLVDCIHRNLPDAPPPYPIDYNRHLLIDAPLSILTDGTNNFKTLWTSPWGLDWYSGNIENKNIFQSIIAGKEKTRAEMWPDGILTLDKGGNIPPGSHQTYAFLMNLYQIDVNNLIAFIHIERESTEPRRDPNSTVNDRLYAIGIAKSSDAGNTWHYAGDIIHPSYDVIGDIDNLYHGVNDYLSNIGGAPYLIKNEAGIDYIYVYFNEYTDNHSFQKSSVARVKFNDFLSDANSGNITHPWEKLGSINPISWGINALTGTGASIFPNVPNRQYDLHSDAAYCLPLKKYLLTVNAADGSSGIIHRSLELYSSVDAINWQIERIVDEYVDPPIGTITQVGYSSFLSTSAQATPDSRVIGSNFNILYVKQYPDIYNADLVTKKFSIDIGPAVRLLLN